MNNDKIRIAVICSSCEKEAAAQKCGGPLPIAPMRYEYWPVSGESTTAKRASHGICKKHYELLYKELKVRCNV